MISKNKQLNKLFDVIINKNMFNYSNECIYSSLINSFANEININDIKKGETIFIVTENVKEKFREIESVSYKNKYVEIINLKLSRNDSVIELKVSDTERLIRFLIFDINRVNENLRGYRCECLIIDINNNENNFSNLTLDSIYNILFPIAIYSKEYKPCHGIMLLYK